MNRRDEQMIVQHNGQDAYESDRQAGAIEMVQVILAGGAGTRLWPLSKDRYPTQLTGLLGQDSLLQAAVTRTRNLPGPWRVAPDPVVVCSNENRLITEEQTRVAGVHSSIVVEPARRDTAPALTLAAAAVSRDGADPIIVAMPVDDAIADVAAFQRAILNAAHYAAEGAIVMLGVPPTRAETGFGYIRFGASLHGDARNIERFVEKPAAELAVHYVQSGGYWWNSGIFVVRAKVWLDAVNRIQPAIYQACVEAIENGMSDEPYFYVSAQHFNSSPPASIDHLVMERIGIDDALPVGVAVLLDAGWTDLGSYDERSDGAVEDVQGGIARDRRLAGRDIASIGVARQYLTDDDVQAMNVAIVHDWLVKPGGAEKVLQQIIQCFPDADLFSLVDFLEDREPVCGKPVTTSFIQDLPFAQRRYRAYLPLMPLAVEQFDLSAYDLVITSSYAVAKGVLVGPDQTHVSYVHSPMRYAWDLQHQYLRESKLTHGPRSWAARALLHYMRTWDARSANGVDQLIANSDFVARRVMKAYRREATVIAPPVEVEMFELCEEKEDFYLTASRLVPYKRVDLVVEAFSRTPQRRLVVIGDGPEMEKIRSMAGPNITILGYKSFEVLKDYMQRAKAFVFAAEEDFGIVVVEAQACGTPVIAYGKGGSLETVRPIGAAHPTGVHFFQQSAESLLEAVEHFESQREQISVATCRANAERFSVATFRRAFMGEVKRTIAARHASPKYTWQ
ncbi:Mannose-1-phosphate guanylyltransferase (GDP) [Paraburkholderia caribensis]|nr:Mannose-1-phosphate guanylyltransferase (GDP) [Paraburkholderia caribensis]